METYVHAGGWKWFQLYLTKQPESIQPDPVSKAIREDTNGGKVNDIMITWSDHQSIWLLMTTKYSNLSIAPSFNPGKRDKPMIHLPTKIVLWKREFHAGGWKRFQIYLNKPPVSIQPDPDSKSVREDTNALKGVMIWTMIKEWGIWP